MSRVTTTRSGCSTACVPGSAARSPVSRTASPRELAADEAVRAADTILVTVPNQLGVAYNARILATIAEHIAPAIGWTPAGVTAAA